MTAEMGRTVRTPVFDHFTFTALGGQTVGVPFTLTITAKDQYGSTYPSFSSSATLSVSKGFITPTTTTNFVNGVLSGFSVTIPDANSGVTVTATASGKTGTSSAFDVLSLGGPYTLSTVASPSGGGIVSRFPDQLSYPPGTSVMLTATPAAGYTFTGWSGDLTGTTNPVTITMTGNRTVTATFAAGPCVVALACRLSSCSVRVVALDGSSNVLGVLTSSTFAITLH